MFQSEPIFRNWEYEHKYIDNKGILNSKTRYTNCDIFDRLKSEQVEMIIDKRIPKPDDSKFQAAPIITDKYIKEIMRMRRIPLAIFLLDFIHINSENHRINRKGIEKRGFLLFLIERWTMQ